MGVTLEYLFLVALMPANDFSGATVSGAYVSDPVVSDFLKPPSPLSRGQYFMVNSTKYMKYTS